MNLTANADGYRNHNDDFRSAQKVFQSEPPPVSGGLKTLQAIEQIYKKHYTGQHDFSLDNRKINTVPLENLIKKAILQRELKISDTECKIEENKDDYPKEQLEKTSKLEDPMQAFCDFKKQEYTYDFKTNSMQMQMFSHFKLQWMEGIESKVLECVESFENDQIKSWKENEDQVQENGPEASQIDLKKYADEKASVPDSLPPMRNRQDMTSFTIVSLDDAEYAIQTIYDCVKQEHGIAFHKIQENNSGGELRNSLKKLKYFTTKKFKNKIYTWVSDQYVSFKVIKDNVYFFTIGIEGKKDEGEDVEEDDVQEGEEPKNQEEEEAEDHVFNIQDKKQNEEKYLQEEQQEDEQKEPGEQTEWKLLLHKFNLKTKKFKIISEQKHTIEIKDEKNKGKNLEPLAVLFVDDFNAKTTSKSKFTDTFNQIYLCILDVEFKIQPKFNYNYFNAGQLTMVSMNQKNIGKKTTKTLFDKSEYLINLWYPVKSLKLSQNIIKSYNKTKEIKDKVLDEKQEQILIISFSDGLKNFESKQKVQKFMPNVIAAFQVNEKQEEFDLKFKDLQLPEHKEHYKYQKFNQDQVSIHKSLNDLVQHICFLNSSSMSWYDRTSKQLINQKITFGRNYNEFFKHLLYTTNYDKQVPYKDDICEYTLVASEYFKEIFDKNEKIYQNEGKMKKEIQILSSSVHTNKTSGLITIILHILQDIRETNLIIFKIKVKNWFVNTNQEILNEDANSFNKFFLECINSQQKDADEQQVFLKPEVFHNSLLTLSRYTNQVCRSFLGITQSKELKHLSDKAYSIKGLIGTQCITTKESIKDAIQNLDDQDRMVFIQDQDVINEIQIIEGGRSDSFPVQFLRFDDQIKRKYVKPQKTVFQCDGRLQVPVIVFNIENNILSDIAFAVINGEIELSKDDLQRDIEVLSLINLQQGDIKMNDNTHQQIGLAQSSEFSEGNRMQNGSLITYYCQNFQALILDSANKLANIVEVQVKWIPKIRNQNFFDIETSIVGMKSLIVNEDYLKIEIFPLFQRQNKKSEEDDIDDKSHFQINGTQLVLEIKREENNDKDENDLDKQQRQKSQGNSYRIEGEDEEKKVQNLKTIYIHYNLRNPGFEDSEFTFVNKFTKSRVKQIDDGLFGMISETWFNYELIQMSNQKIFNDNIMMKILIELHRKSINSKLFDVHNFMNVSSFLNGMPSSGVLTVNQLFQDNMLKQFEAQELYGGKSIIELTNDSNVIQETIKKLAIQNKLNKFDFEYISNPFTDSFCLNSIESALVNDKDNSRYLNYQKQGLLFGKECIRMTMDYKSVIQLFLEKNNMKQAAESLVQYLLQEMKDLKIVHSQVMSLMNIIIDKQWDNRKILNLFQDQEINQDEQELQDNVKESKKQYSLESQISSKAKILKELPNYMQVQLSAFPKEFDRAEVNDEYFAGKIKEQIDGKKKSDKQFDGNIIDQIQDKNDSNEQNGFSINYSYLNVLDFEIQNRLQLVRKSKNNAEYLEALKEKFTQYDLSKWLKVILDMDECLINNSSIIKDLIDYQFMNTKRFYKFNLLVYLTLYILPLVIQMFKLDRYFVVALNLICLFTQIYFFFYEVIDMKAGIFQYFESIWNWFDTSQFVFYLVYFYIRMNTCTQSFIPDKDQAVEIENLQKEEKIFHDIMPLFNFIVLSQSFLGLLFYMKIFKEFGKLIRLLSICIKKVAAFTVFLMIWVFLLSFLFKIIGANFEDDDTFNFSEYDDNFGDYRMMNQSLIYLIQTFRNSIGDISTPHYQYWWRRMEQYQKNLHNLDNEQKISSFFYKGQFYIYLIWMLWFFEIYMMVIIMLNFLIAIVSQSYEEANSSQIETQYHQKSEMTQEYMQCMDYFDNHGYRFMTKLFSYKTENFDYILIASERNKESDSRDEWVGMVKTIQKFIQANNVQILKTINNLDQKLDYKIDLNKNEISLKINEISFKIDVVLNKLEYNVKDKNYN